MSFSEHKEMPPGDPLPVNNLPDPDPGFFTPSSANSREAGDGLSPSSGIHTGSSQSSQPGAGASGTGMYYQPNMSTNWGTGTPGSSSSAYTFSNSGLAGPPPGPLMTGSSYGSNRSLFGQGTPSLPHFGSRTSQSPAHGDNLPQPPSYQQQSPFPTGLGSGNGLPPTLPSQGSHNGTSGNQHPLPQSILGSQGPSPVSQAPPPSLHMPSGPPPTNSHHSLPSPNSSYYPSSSTPQTSSFPSYTTAPSPQSSISGGHGSYPPSTGSGGLRGLASMTGSHNMAPLGYQARSPYGSGGYGSMQHNGPVLANLHSPGAPLTMVGGHMMGSHYGPPGHGPLPPQIYGPGAHGQSPHHGPGGTHDRPFKCDTCPQSFNRNHDLKRHKRIHLAVKPYPCNHCDKSFSRKDALKRHRLVKGCGDKDLANATQQGDMDTPPDRSDVMSDGTEESPRVKPESL